MNAEILAVGTELLLGDIVNTNAQYLSRQLAGLGIGVYFQTVVGDNEARLLDACRIAFTRADIVIATGGLGPTEDDLTKETAAKYFGKPMVLHEESLAEIQAYFAQNSFTMTENNRKQAYLPEGAQPLPNHAGTAPGVLLEENGKMMILLPGPPMECIPMFEESVLPILRARTDRVFVSRVLRVCGVGESMLEDMLKDMIDSQSNPSIAPYAKLGEVRLRLTASAADEAEARSMIEPIAAEIYHRLGNHIYGEDNTELEAAVAAALAERGLTLACAESCTGGMLTSRLVDCPGISAVLTEAVVTYSNHAKTARLGVRPETLARFGAVSAECALEMAEGIARTAGTDVGLSVTGVAGPSGGTEEKPVGLVYIGLWLRGRADVKELRLTGSRERIRMRTVTMALDFLRREISKH